MPQPHDSSTATDSVWVFGYGSLIYKADFAFIERRRALLRGWSRRFWQGSHDHRGTPEAPGRVVTLVRDPAAVCVGMAYRVAPEVFEHLDYREKNGYTRIVGDFEFDGGQQASGVVYLADERNEAWLGPAPEPEIARHIARSQGPSGSNRDYLLHLAQSLRELGAVDPHVFAIEAELVAL